LASQQSSNRPLSVGQHSPASMDRAAHPALALQLLPLPLPPLPAPPPPLVPGSGPGLAASSGAWVGSRGVGVVVSLQQSSSMPWRVGQHSPVSPAATHWGCAEQASSPLGAGGCVGAAVVRFRALVAASGSGGPQHSRKMPRSLGQHAPTRPLHAEYAEHWDSPPPLPS